MLSYVECELGSWRVKKVNEVVISSASNRGWSRHPVRAQCALIDHWKMIWLVHAPVAGSSVAVAISKPMCRHLVEKAVVVHNAPSSRHLAWEHKWRRTNGERWAWLCMRMPWPLRSSNWSVKCSSLSNLCDGQPMLSGYLYRHIFLHLDSSTKPTPFYSKSSLPWSSQIVFL